MSNLNTMVQVTMTLPEELMKGISAMARMKRMSEESLLRLWVEDGLEREELRFERLLLFADLVEELDSETIQLLARLKTQYFDETHDGQRGLDTYMVRSQNQNHLYQGTSD